LKTFNIYKNLSELNALPYEEAERLFFGICGSKTWAHELTKRRPFPMLEHLFETAADVWFSLPPSERIEAFGQLETATSFSGTTPIAGNGIDKSRREVSNDDEFVRASRLYRNKFGFIFVVCGEGKTAAEVTAICKARFGNSPATELQIAAEEHKKLIEIRLNKVLEK
jgi:2-oxo-4-hydroxy-4-carboxy-5-ureidoimidazoline decarboxylase